MKKLFFLFAFIPTILLAQHVIQGTFSPPEDFTYAILYKATPTSLDYLNRGKVEEDGAFKIELDSTVTAGMYKIVYGIPQEDYNFDFIYDGKEDIVLNFSLVTGLEFKESVENKLWASYTKSMEMVNITISNYYAQESTDKKAFNDIFKTLKDTQAAFEDASKGTMASMFIKANRPYVPTEYEVVTTYSNNLKTTFFKNVDFGNPLLQSSDFLNDRIMAYVFGMSATNSNEDYKKHIDEVVAAIGPENTLVTASLLEQIWHKMVSLANIDVAQYISDAYLYNLARESNNDALYKSLMSYKNSAIGTIAMDFPIINEMEGKRVNTSLHQLSDTDYYLLVFWSSSCGYCLDELPVVKSFLEENKINVKVVAFGLEEDKVNWSTIITQFPDFIHILGLDQWNNPIALAYGVNSTPTYFILDKDKKIINKPKDLATLKSDLENLK